MSAAFGWAPATRRFSEDHAPQSSRSTSLLFGVVGEERSPGFPDFYRVLDRTDGRVAISALGLSGSGTSVVRDSGVGSVAVFPGLVDVFAAAATTMSTRT